MQLQTDTYRNATKIEIMEEVLPFEEADVLELGCGRARWTRTIAENFPVKSVTATEVDKVQHEKNLQINDLPRVQFVYGGAEDIHLDDDSVDIVIMLKSLHHVPVPLMGKALEEIHRVLRPGGLAYISEPVYA
uniref:class I SAM-dependent methyltransferase n=1 Tax=Thiolapillus sp. TaxID=2017437 RepID=UPI003AF8DA1B